MDIWYIIIDNSDNIDIQILNKSHASIIDKPKFLKIML